MQTLEGLQKRIKTAHDLLAVVKTMKSLAAVNIRHFETAALTLEDYNQVIDQGWQVLFRRAAMLPQRKKHPANVLLVFGSSQGMCGQYNETIAHYALETGDDFQKKGEGVRYWVVGDKLYSAFEEKPGIDAHFELPGGLAGINGEVEQIIERLDELQRPGKAVRFYILHHRVSRAASYHPVTHQLFPMDREWLATRASQPWPGHSLPMTGTDNEILFKHLLRHYLFGSLYRGFAQAMASENAARLAAMQAAEKNIIEKEDELQARFRETRQGVITAELFDIIAGFEALS